MGVFIGIITVLTLACSKEESATQPVSTADTQLAAEPPRRVDQDWDDQMLEELELPDSRPLPNINYLDLPWPPDLEKTCDQPLGFCAPIDGIFQIAPGGNGAGRSVKVRLVSSALLKVELLEPVVVDQSELYDWLTEVWPDEEFTTADAAAVADEWETTFYVEGDLPCDENDSSDLLDEAGVDEAHPYGYVELDVSID